MAPIVGEESIVHHIVLFKQPKSELRKNYDPAVGYNCMNNFNLFEGMLGGWAPGATPIEFAPDHGFLVTPQDNLIMQIHYYNSGSQDESILDQSGYEFRTKSSVGTPLTLLPLGSYSFTIPAGEEAYTEEYSQYIPESYEYDGIEIPIPGLTLHGVFPHMHVLGSGYKMWVEHGDGTEECAVAGDSYDFYNQLTYLFKDPLTVNPGDTVRWSCTWNNSPSNPAG
jgi:hypothetical protein